MSKLILVVFASAVLVISFAVVRIGPASKRDALSSASRAAQTESTDHDDESIFGDDRLSDGEFLEHVRGFQSLTRVTENPFLMNAPSAGQCLIFPHHEVHGDRYCDVFVSNDAVKIIQSGEGKYPEQTFIVKAKYTTPDRRRIELFTVMRKMGSGYAPEQGDWEYSVVDAEISHVLARGRINSCAICHEFHATTDYVTRTYIGR